MPIQLTQSLFAVGPNITSSFLAVGGTAPYVYSVQSGGGSINASTGIFTAPANINPAPANSTSVIKVTDSVGGVATATILVGNPLTLFCEILQRELGLANGRVYLWDQKINQPTDSGLYIAVSVPTCKPFGNVNRQVGESADFLSEQYIAMSAVVDIDIMSRGPFARDRKEEILLALYSNYSQQQQTANSFYISRLPGSTFQNLSEIDGAAIPYRYRISVNLQYAYSKNSNVDYFDDFEREVITDN